MRKLLKSYKTEIDPTSEQIQKIKKTDDGEQILDYLLIARYFERIGDHATNIAKWVVFAITGKK